MNKNFIEWLIQYAGGGGHWREKILIGEHDIALALWKDRQREIDRLQALLNETRKGAPDPLIT